MRTRRWTAAALLAVAVAGCASPGAAGSNNPGVSEPTTVAPGTVAPPERRVVAKSSAQDLAAVFDAAGVDDPEQWAQAVLAGRPYPEGPAGQDKLREVLAQNQADADDVAKITNALVP